MDRVTEATRSRIMAAVHTKNTSAEKTVRSIVYGMGYRYTLNRRELPGSPDLVFKGRRKVIFVHGCFWHGHSCKYGRLPKSKLDYWQPKIQANRNRDRMQSRRLRKAGWSLMVIWQCQLKGREELEARIRRFLDE